MLGVTNPLVDEQRERNRELIRDYARDERRDERREPIRRPMQLRFDSVESLPRRTLLTRRTVKSATPFDFTRAMHELVHDIAARSPSFAHLDPSRILMTFTPQSQPEPLRPASTRDALATAKR